MTDQRVVLAAPGQQTISFSREFDAPGRLVFEAHIDPDLVPRWIGPRGTQLTMRDFDPRTGGCWSYLISAADGRSWAFHGSFHEVTAPNRIVQTWEYEGDPGHPTLEVLTFSDVGDRRSRIDGLSLFLTVEDRDAMLSGMDAGMDENFKRLDEMLATPTRA
jgi:uncharacterized protein YndB with AHSA1/START domain